MADSKLNVGINSYTTIEDANKYVQDNYMSISPEYQAWFNEDMSESDKEVSLIQSAQALNNLKYAGRKKIKGQSLAFPRTYPMMPGVIYMPFVFQNADASLSQGMYSDTGLESAKRAQMENSIAQLTLGTRTVVSAKKRALSGLSSSKGGTISETYNIDNKYTQDALIGLYAAEKVKVILKAWLTQAVYTV